MAKAKVNKSDVIRKILSDIGAIAKDAPEGWAKTVMTKLNAKGIKVSAPMIYQLRNREMAKAGVAVKTKRRHRKVAAKAKAVSLVVGSSTPATKHDGKYDALFAVKKLANELGGLEHVESAVAVLKRLG
jgi:hypothetical protein